MSCKKCGSRSSCGCTDTALTTIPVLICPGTDPCENPNPCSEIVDAQCITYLGEGIVDLGINKGDSLNEIIQKLVLLATNPGCVTPGSSCLSTFNIALVQATTTTVVVGWALSTTAINYQVEYKLASDTLWTLSTLLGPTAVQDTITGLTADTDYHFRVNSICTIGECYSVTLLITTSS